jgi:hypothetical protein
MNTKKKSCDYRLATAKNGEGSSRLPLTTGVTVFLLAICHSPSSGEHCDKIDRHVSLFSFSKRTTHVTQ